MDEGEPWDWFPVTQGVRQGCAMPHLLFNDFSAAFSRASCREIQRLKEKTGAGAGALLDQVRRMVWRMIYADDTGVV